MTTNKYYAQIDNEVIELTGPALDELLNVQAEIIAEQQQRQITSEETKAQRQALLDKLGITEEEARLLLGGN